MHQGCTLAGCAGQGNAGAGQGIADADRIEGDAEACRLAGRRQGRAAMVLSVADQDDVGIGRSAGLQLPQHLANSVADQAATPQCRATANPIQSVEEESVVKRDRAVLGGAAGESHQAETVTTPILNHLNHVGDSRLGRLQATRNDILGQHAA